MERDFFDAAKTRRRRPQSDDEQRSSGPEMPQAMGNKAFTNLTKGRVDRSGVLGDEGTELDPQVGDAINERRGAGEPLDVSTRADMETNLGADLSDVRVHTDSTAHDLNRAVSAEAFTTGSDVFFKSGKYSPETDSGRELLAHELTHVTQQRVAGPGSESRVSDPADPTEVEARNVAENLGPRTGASVARQEELPEEELAMSIDRQPEEEELMMSIDRQEEEEEMLQPSIDRQEEEEEELAMSIDRHELPDDVAMSIDRQEELPEEELAMSIDRQPIEEEEEMLQP